MEASTGNQTDRKILSEDFQPVWRQQLEQHLNRMPGSFKDVEKQTVKQRGPGDKNLHRSLRLG